MDRILSFKSGGLRFNSFFFLLFSEALSLFVGFIVTFTNSTVFPTMNSTMDTLGLLVSI